MKKFKSMLTLLLDRTRWHCSWVITFFSLFWWISLQQTDIWFFCSLFFLRTISWPFLTIGEEGVLTEFFSTNSWALLPTFRTNFPGGSHFAQMGSHFAQNTTPNPCSTPFGDLYEQKTLPTRPQNTPFPGLNLKVGEMNYCLDNLDPNWAICLKNRQDFSGNGQKYWIHLGH